MYYGWKIVGATFVTLFISVGFLFYSYGVFFPALEAEFGGSRLAISIGLAVMNITMGLLAPFLGRAIDTWSTRRVMLIGAFCMAIGFFAASRITALWHFYVLLGTFLGVGGSMMGQLPSSTLVSNWFIRRRGTALGVATMGVSLSGVVMAPTTTWLIGQFGWRTTFVIFGCLTAGIVMPLVSRIVVNRPEDMGLNPDNAPDEGAFPLDTAETDSTRRPSKFLIAEREGFPEFTVSGTLRNVNFWAITLVIAFNFFAMGAILTHMIPHARDIGVGSLQAAYVLTASAGVGVFGKILFGYLADFVDTRFALLFSMGFQAVATLLLLKADSYSALLIVGAIFGLGMGGIVPLWGSFIGEYFGRKSFGRVMGLMGPCMLPIQVAGVPFAGLVYDLTGQYTVAYRTFVGVYVCASLALLLLGRPGSAKADAPVPAEG